jgi:outer membrane protein assembly factor BamB
LVCCRLANGEVVWKKSFSGDFQGKMESVWGYSESPLVDGERLICTPGGKDAMVVCLDKKTGSTLWKGKAPAGKLRGNDGAGYSSIVISSAAGRKQYVQLIGHGIVSYDASTGELLWNYDRVANTTANIPTPIIKDDFVFCSTGYDDGGTALLQVQKAGRGLSAKEVSWRHGDGRGLRLHGAWPQQRFSGVRGMENRQGSMGEGARSGLRVSGYPVCGPEALLSLSRRCDGDDRFRHEEVHAPVEVQIGDPQRGELAAPGDCRWGFIHSRSGRFGRLQLEKLGIHPPISA